MTVEKSHIIPQFVFDTIKSNSPTGFLRGGMSKVDLRRQDGDKPKLLCNDCEQRFSNWENTFAEKVFKPYHESSPSCFTYGPWLSYFISSVNWRTLHLDNIGFRLKCRWGGDTQRILDDAETVLADFLLGKRSDIDDMENHMLPMFKITNASSPLKEPNFWFRVTTFDYTFCAPGIDGFYVCANLAGVLIFTVIRKGRKDIWKNTLVDMDGGRISEPYRIRSPLMYNMVDLLAECSQMKLSKAQQDKIIGSLQANQMADEAKAVKYRELDRKLREE